jgi:hypothetical protein
MKYTHERKSFKNIIIMNEMKLLCEKERSIEGGN